MEKSACVNFLFLLWTILGCLIVESSAANRGSQWNRNPEETTTEADKSIKCYKCNSANDPNCADPFEPYTIGIVDCSLLPRPEHLEPPNITATICRKTIQKIYGKTRVVRDCGYIRDDRDDKECMKRSGTHDVQVYYCSCTKSLCNGGHLVRISHVILALPLLAAVITAFTTRKYVS